MVVEGLRREPVSVKKFPAKREITGNFPQKRGDSYITRHQFFSIFKASRSVFPNLTSREFLQAGREFSGNEAKKQGFYSLIGRPIVPRDTFDLDCFDMRERIKHT
jgi:hypothetical protein